VERGKGIDVAGMASEKVSLLQCCEGVAGGGAVLASPTIAVVVVPPAPATKSKSRSFNNHRRTPNNNRKLTWARKDLLFQFQSVGLAIIFINIGFFWRENRSCMPDRSPRTIIEGTTCLENLSQNS
jgi:hypothetical protein